MIDTAEQEPSHPRFLQQRRPPALRKIPVEGRRARPEPFGNLGDGNLLLSEHGFRHR